jgi:hypothetical protein
MLTIVEHTEQVVEAFLKKVEVAFSSDVKAVEARVAALEAKLAPKKASAPVAPVVAPETK